MRKNMTRREEYADATRQAIFDASRSLFRDRGFFFTKVTDIAEVARVSPATVYAVSGGKHCLLRSLMDTSTSAPLIADTIDTITKMDSANEIIFFLSKRIRLLREEYADVIRLILQTAPHERSAAETLDIATGRYRKALETIAQRLVDLGQLKDDMTFKETTDILWFYFGYSGLFTLVDENKWSYDRAETWLAEEAAQSLLASPTA